MQAKLFLSSERLTFPVLVYNSPYEITIDHTLLY